MSLPQNFEWMNGIGKWPYMVEEGAKLLGIKEIPGPKSNPTILGFADFLGVKDIYTNDDQAWCALAHNYIAVKAGKKINYTDRYDYIRALSFKKLGPPDWEIIDLDRAVFGDSLVFQRPEGGHDALYIGESPANFIVMGGNQNNQYSFTKVNKNRLVAVRRPVYTVGKPPSAKKYFLNDSGIPQGSLS